MPVAKVVVAVSFINARRSNFFASNADSMNGIFPAQPVPSWPSIFLEKISDHGRANIPFVHGFLAIRNTARMALRLRENGRGRPDR
jgi:hypothetical protein